MLLLCFPLITEQLGSSPFTLHYLIHDKYAVCEKCSVYRCGECIKVIGKNKTVDYVILVSNGSTESAHFLEKKNR